MADLSAMEFLCYALMMIGLLWMGMYPQSMLDMAQPSLQALNVAFPG
jgi:NADH-quinone oxidoreductase subunit M